MQACAGALSLNSARHLDDASEKALVERCRRNDFEAFGKLVDAYQNRVFGFGMPMPAEARPTPDRMHAYFGDKALVTMRSARGTFPGSEITLNFQEFGAPDRKPVRHRVQDPGGPILPVTVQDLPAVIEQVRTNGGIVGAGDTSVTLAPDARSSWIRDPNGVLIQVSLPRLRN